MNFYAGIFPEAEKDNITRYEKDHPHAEEGDENCILFGSMIISGQQIMFMDMIGPCPDFSWATSLFFDCKDETEFDMIFNGLSEGGSVMMGPEPVGDLRKCAWVTDKFGVTWQPVWA